MPNETPSRPLEASREWHVVGVGANSVDFAYLLPGDPQPSGSFAKAKIRRRLVLCGGQLATAMCAAGFKASSNASTAARMVNRGMVASGNVLA